MIGKAYYLTTLGDWQRHAARFANSHYIVLGAAAPRSAVECGGLPPLSSMDISSCAVTPTKQASPDESESKLPHSTELPEPGTDIQEALLGAACRAPTADASIPLHAEMKIVVLIEADEGVHLSLEDEPAFEALPHPLAQKPISDATQSALAQHGVGPGATTFDAAEALARVHPLLRHRVF